jgi:hypothetical protein
VNSQVAWAFLPVQAAMASAGGVPPSAAPVDAVVCVRELVVCVTAAGAEIASAAGAVTVGGVATAPPEQADSNMATINIRYGILFFTFSPYFLA